MNDSTSQTCSFLRASYTIVAANEFWYIRLFCTMWQYSSMWSCWWCSVYAFEFNCCIFSVSSFM